jgi:hypothetical protein
MKDFDRNELEASRPSIDVIEGIEYCLNNLYQDNTKKCSDFVVNGLMFEELIGVLLLAKDAINNDNK